MFSDNLLRCINSGRAYLLIGSGPSSELGYPTWRRLCELVVDHVKATVRSFDGESYAKFLSNRQYPELLSLAQRDLGGRAQLVAFLKTVLVPTEGRRSPTYEALTKWPFAVYLTTNFDNAIFNHLAAHRRFFTVLRNRREDCAQIRADASDMIVKVHGDLDHPDEAIITSDDYRRVRVGGEREYLRFTIQAVFKMFDVLIIGHSLTDPDLQLLLEAAREIANPARPIYMALANVSRGEAQEFLERYNIEIIPYHDHDGSHGELKRILRLADNYVAAPEEPYAPIAAIHEEQAEAATSLLIFRKTQPLLATDAGDGLYLPLILKTLSDREAPVAAIDLLGAGSFAVFPSNAEFGQVLDQQLGRAVDRGLAKSLGGKYALTKSGEERARELSAARQTEESQAIGQFALEMKAKHQSVSEADLSLAASALKDALVDLYSARGLEMASVVIANQSLRASNLPDIFRTISRKASVFSSPDTRAAFVEAATAFIVHPTPSQQKYLASMSQGFFLYHMAGQDPACSHLRMELFANTAWFLDSSVFLPFLAVGCHNHAYAVDFLEQLQARRALLYTLDCVADEAWTHLKWSIGFMRRYGHEPVQMLSYVLSKHGYKQNLFIDGYVRLAADGEFPTFDAYMGRTFPNGQSRDEVVRLIDQAGVSELSLSGIDGFEQNDWGDRPELVDKLKDARTRRGTYRSFTQVKAEADALILIRNLRAGKYRLPDGVAPEKVYFVSQSHILDVVARARDAVTWTPEAVYRYLLSLPGAIADPSLLQECMLGEFFSAGVSFVDYDRYLRFFGPVVKQAKISYEEQKQKYVAATESHRDTGELDRDFDQTPDLEKPLFVSQMAWRIAADAERKAGAAAARTRDAESRAQSAETRAREAERERDKAIKARRQAEQRANRLKNLGDPKHLRKRERQAKKRRRRKRR